MIRAGSVMFTGIRLLVIKAQLHFTATEADRNCNEIADTQAKTSAGVATLWPFAQTSCTCRQRTTIYNYANDRRGYASPGNRKPELDDFLIFLPSPGPVSYTHLTLPTMAVV